MLDVLESKDICISCCDKNASTKNIQISRDGSSSKGQNIVSFSLCDKCLSTLATEFSLFTSTPYVDRHNDSPKMRKKGGKNGK